MKTFAFPSMTFTGTGDGCVFEIESALQLVWDEGYLANKIRCSFEGRAAIEKAVMEGVSLRFTAIVSTSNTQPIGGFVITGYKDRRTGQAVSIQGDPNLQAEFLIEAEAPGEHLASRLTAIASGQVPARPKRQISFED